MSSEPEFVLSPCPFCGKEAVSHAANERWQIVCDTCIAGTAGFNTKQEAIEAWNRRAARPTAPAGEPVAWQRRQVYSDIPGYVPQWQIVSKEEATGYFERRSGYEYRPLYAAPPDTAAIREQARREALEEVVQWHQAEIAQIERQVEDNIAYGRRTGCGRVSSEANDACRGHILHHQWAIDAVLRMANRSAQEASS